MIVKTRTYESVPIGSSIFEETMDYLRVFLAANFRFSTNAVDNSGGHFQGDDIVTVTRGGYKFVTPADKDRVNLFAQRGVEFFMMDAYNVNGHAVTDDRAVQSQEWQLIPDESTSTHPEQLLFTNTGVDEMALPYRPVRKGSDTGNYSGGFHGITLSGIPQQRGVDYTYSTNDITTTTTPNLTGGTFLGSQLVFNSLTLGAEYPKPTQENFYDHRFTDPDRWFTLAEFMSELDSTVRFEHTNFDEAHILLQRAAVGSGPERYIYIPKSDNGAPGTYTMVDEARGVIKLHLDVDVLADPAFAGNTVDVSQIRFTVISAEQLHTERSGGITNYYSRFGDIYDGDTDEVILVQVDFDGDRYSASKIAPVQYINSRGALLLRDTTDIYVDAYVILAVKYKGAANKSKIAAAQETRYELDVLQLYFSAGTTQPSDDYIYATSQENRVEWWNRDVRGGGFTPVNRGVKVVYTLLTASETDRLPKNSIDPNRYGQGWFAEDISFDPLKPFSIVDTIGMDSLNDTLLNNLQHRDILRWDENAEPGDLIDQGRWVNVPLNLNALDDVTKTATIGNNILVRDRTDTDMLISQTVRYALGYNPLNEKGGVIAAVGTEVSTDQDGPASGRISYTTPYVWNGTGNFDNDLVTKGYVDAGITEASNTLSDALTAHIDSTSVHGATRDATNNRLVIRDSTGSARVITPGIDNGTTVADNSIANIGYVKDFVDSFEFDDSNIGDDAVLARHINDGEISDNHINANANISLSKLASVRDRSWFRSGTDGKVDDGYTITNSSVLVYNSSGNADLIPYASGNANNSIARRTGSGRLKITDASDTDEAVTLSQLNSKTMYPNAQRWVRTTFLMGIGGSAPATTDSTNRPITQIGESDTNIVNPGLLVQGRGSGMAGIASLSAHRDTSVSGAILSNGTVYYTTPLTNVSLAGVLRTPSADSSATDSVEIRQISGTSRNNSNTVMVRSMYGTVSANQARNPGELTNLSQVNALISAATDGLGGGGGTTSKHGSYLRVSGKIIIAWADDGLDSAGTVAMTGPTLPAGGSYEVLTALATPLANTQKAIAISLRQSPVQPRMNPNNNRQPLASVTGTKDAYGSGNAWSVRVVWIIWDANG